MSIKTDAILDAKDNMQPHIDALIEVIRKESTGIIRNNLGSSTGAIQFALGGIAIQILIDSMLHNLPELAKGKSRDLFDENYSHAVTFGTMLFFAKRDVE